MIRHTLTVLLSRETDSAKLPILHIVQNQKSYVITDYLYFFLHKKRN